MDIHIWYTLLSAIVGGVMGARARLGEVQLFQKFILDLAEGSIFFFFLFWSKRVALFTKLYITCFLEWLDVLFLTNLTLCIKYLFGRYAPLKCCIGVLSPSPKLLLRISSLPKRSGDNHSLWIIYSISGFFLRVNHFFSLSFRDHAS